MKLTRRAIFQIGAGATALPMVTTISGSHRVKAANAPAAGMPLARRLADYALGLR